MKNYWSLMKNQFENEKSEDPLHSLHMNEHNNIRLLCQFLHNHSVHLIHFPDAGSFLNLDAYHENDK